MRREDSDGALIMQLPGDREERLVCSEILLHPSVFPRKMKAHPFPYPLAMALSHHASLHRHTKNQIHTEMGMGPWSPL